jgi:hypothetical protein
MNCLRLPGLRAGWIGRWTPGTARTVMAVLLIGMGACAQQRERAPRSPAQPTRPPDTHGFNLSGYPPAFREGFDAGCTAARRGQTKPVDPQRQANDPQYRLGWQDGQSICRKR